MRGRYGNHIGAARDRAGNAGRDPRGLAVRYEHRFLQRWRQDLAQPAVQLQGVGIQESVLAYGVQAALYGFDIAGMIVAQDRAHGVGAESR